MSFFEAYQSCTLFGALRYFSNLKNTVCLINGPSGCSFYARNSVISLNGYYDKTAQINIPKIFTLDFSENDVIFGNEDKLCAVLEEIIRKYSPELVVIFNCCVSEVIGIDIDQIAVDFETQNKTIKFIAIHTSGFRGDQREGMRMASELICKNFFNEKTKTRDDKVNVLGEFDSFNRSSVELINQLNKIGIIDVKLIPGQCSIKDLYDAPNAFLNLITCQNASRYMAEKMKSEFGIPYIGKGYDMYGVENSYQFYLEIYHYFKKDISSLNQERENCLEIINEFKNTLHGKRAVVVAGTRRAVGYSNILKELGLSVDLLFCENNEEYIQTNEFIKLSRIPMLNEHIDDLAVRISLLCPDVIFTTLPEMIAPMDYLSRLSEDFAGFSGCIRMAKYLSNYFMEKHSSNYVLINN